MQTLKAESVVKSLHSAGVSIKPTANGGLRVAPASRLTPELREAIRDTKTELLRYFSIFAAANDPAPEPPADPGAWRGLAQAYQAHHFGCRTCIAAGRGEQYDRRCAVGLVLWAGYSAAAVNV